MYLITAFCASSLHAAQPTHTAARLIPPKYRSSIIHLLRKREAASLLSLQLTETGPALSVGPSSSGSLQPTQTALPATLQACFHSELCSQLASPGSTYFKGSSCFPEIHQYSQFPTNFRIRKKTSLTQHNLLQETDFNLVNLFMNKISEERLYIQEKQVLHISL